MGRDFELTDCPTKLEWAAAYEGLPERFGTYGMTAQPDKTRLVAFQRRVAGTTIDAT